MNDMDFTAYLKKTSLFYIYYLLLINGEGFTVDLGKEKKKFFLFFIYYECHKW
jgi:hypothetical protein